MASFPTLPCTLPTLPMCLPPNEIINLFGALRPWGQDRPWIKLLSRPGLRSLVDTGVGVGRSRLFWVESESKLVKFCRLRLRSGVAGCLQSTDYDFGRMATHSPQKCVLRLEENDSGSVEIKPNRHLVIEFHLMNGITDN